MFYEQNTAVRKVLYKEKNEQNEGARAEGYNNEDDRTTTKDNVIVTSESSRRQSPQVVTHVIIDCKGCTPPE